MFRRWEQARYAAAAEKTHVPAPLFILGHWRSGTTHLHNLLTVDRRFAFPNIYQALYPHAFLTMEAMHSRIIEWFLPKRRPMDNVAWSMQSPQEDEFALCITTLMSPCLGWCFPSRRTHYDRYLTFRDVSELEVDEWKRGLSSFLARLSMKVQRPLVLKSPAHTCRIKHLLAVFPQAKFVHIHRNPYVVFQSTCRMLSVNFRLHGLQPPPVSDLDDWIFRQYRSMYDVYFEERSLIPDRQFCELSFEELEQDPIQQLCRIYAALDLPDFGDARAAVEGYVQSIAGYEKNLFPKLSPDIRHQIAREWRPCFEEWGYADEPPA
ncbi:MAG: sulfotransferase [Planctomycetaceae bacterium]|nr:sulfotransferase [Planctomycetaceae bacterium]